MAPNGHTFVWESSFDSARRAQGRNGPDAFSHAAFDPFELFNSMFSRDFHEMEASYGLDDSFNAMNDWHGMSTSTFGRPTSFGAPPPGFMREPILGMPMHHDAPFGGVGMSPFGLMSGLSPMHTSAPGQSSFSSSMSSLSFNGGNTGGTSETRRTTVVNGRRETTITKRDEHGNETVRRISPDGETVYVMDKFSQALKRRSLKQSKWRPAIQSLPRKIHGLVSPPAARPRAAKCGSYLVDRYRCDSLEAVHGM